MPMNSNRSQSIVQLRVTHFFLVVLQKNLFIVSERSWSMTIWYAFSVGWKLSQNTYLSSWIHIRRSTLLHR